MPRVAGLLTIGLLAAFTAGGAQRGCRDLWHSATTLRYPAVRDMRHSVAILPQKGVLRVPDSASVPVMGRERDLGRDVLAATLVNPTPPAELEASIRRGGAKFRVTCVPCHGPTMQGGPVAPLFMPPPDLLAQATRQRTDGFIYSYIRHGGLVMPSYGAQVTQQEAWDLINYLRHMQEVSPR